MSSLACSEARRNQARALRRSMTREEKHLWYDFLSSYPVRFRRQRPIGEYIVDFYCPKARLVVELDGQCHNTGEIRRHDAERTAYLESLGLKVIRFFDYDIWKNFDRICRHIDVETKNRITG